MAEPTLPDAADRLRIQVELDRTFVVEASAGTGKTTCLVDRVEQLVLRGGIPVDEVAAITFTRKAAGELRLKIRERLEQARLGAERPDTERSRAAAALRTLEGAAIGTIHSFAATLLRARPIESRLDPDFRVEQRTRGRLRTQFRDWLELSLDERDELLRRYFLVHGDEQALFRTLAALWELRDLDVPAAQRDWNREGAIGKILDEVRDSALEILEATNDDAGVRRVLEPLLTLGRAVARPDFPRQDLDRCESELLRLSWRPPGRTRPRIETSEWSVPRPEARELLLRAWRLHVALGGFKRAARRDLAERILPRLHALLRGSERTLEESLRRAGALDHLGLLLGARDLVRDQPTVRAAFQNRYRRVLLDEVQDTDPLQLQLVAFLTAADYSGSDWREALRRTTPGRLFAVGDPKQSIYRFRRADLDLYQELKDLVIESGGELIRLTTSFRPRPGVARFVNEAFERIFETSRGPQPEYGPIVAHRCAGPTPPVVWLTLPCRPRVGPIRETEPGAVASWLAGSLRRPGFEPSDPLLIEDQGELRPAEPRDVAYLFKRFVHHGRDLTEPYVRALAERGIRSVLFSGSSFHDREEVDATRTVLRLIDRPEDRIAAFAALKGPYFGFLDAELLGKLDAARSLDPLRITDGQDPDLAAALALLRQLHDSRNQVPVARTVQQLYDRTRILSSQACQPQGPRRVANLMKVQRLARQFDAERGEAASFRAFVERLVELEAEPDSPLAEEGRGGVRFLTMHRAKGLEFPVVYLADPTCPALLGGQPRRLYRRRENQVLVPIAGTEDLLPRHDRHELEREEVHQIAESERLLYVATTRARDCLILPRVVDWKNDHWDRLAHRLVPALDDLAQAGEAVRIVQPPDLDLPTRNPTIEPDPDALAATYQEWKTARREVRERASQPSCPATPVTTLSAARPAAPDLREPAGIGDGSPVVFAPEAVKIEFGTFVHLVLSHIPLDADREMVEQWVRALGRETPWLEDQIDLACEHVTWTLEQDLLRRARAASEVHRELPVAARLDDGNLAEGVVDLVFREPAGLVVVDYKTGPWEAKHTGQLSLYARLLGEDQVAEHWALYSGLRRVQQTG